MDSSDRLFNLKMKKYKTSSQSPSKKRVFRAI
jgi:hypothetical protein